MYLNEGAASSACSNQFGCWNSLQGLHMDDTVRLLHSKQRSAKQQAVAPHLLLALDHLRSRPAKKGDSWFANSPLLNTRAGAKMQAVSKTHTRAADLSVSESESRCFWCTASAHRTQSV